MRYSHSHSIFQFQRRIDHHSLSPAVTCSSDLTIKLWDTANEYKNVKTLYGHDHSVSSARFTPAGDFVVSASRDRSIKVWEVATG